MRELSRILAKDGVSNSTEEQILTEVEILSTTLETTDEPKSQELQNDLLQKNAEEDDILGITFEGEKTQIEELSIYMTIDPSCAQTTTQLE